MTNNCWVMFARGKQISATRQKSRAAVELYNIFVDLGLQNRSIDQITENEKQLIEAVHGLDVKASGVAISILSNYFGWDYTLSCEKMGECDGSNSRRAGGSATDKFNAALAKVKTDRFAKAQKGEQTIDIATSALLNVAPNPAINIASVYYHTIGNGTSAKILLVDVNGKQVMNENISNNSGKYEFATSNYANGIYNLMLLYSNGKSISKKLVINH